MLNIELIKKVFAHIEAEPRRLNMHLWGCRNQWATAPCGTAACFAGWTVLLSRPPEEWDQAFTSNGILKGFNKTTISDEAGELLGLSYSEGRSLFIGPALCFKNGSPGQIESLKNTMNILLQQHGHEERV